MMTYIRISAIAIGALSLSLSLGACSKKGSSAPARAKSTNFDGSTNDGLNSGIAQFVLDGNRRGSGQQAKLSVLSGNRYVIMHGFVEDESESRFVERGSGESAEAIVRTFQDMDFVAAIVDLQGRYDDRDSSASLYLFRHRRGDSYDLLTNAIEVQGLSDIGMLEDGLEELAQDRRLSLEKTIDLFVRTHRSNKNLNLDEILEKLLGDNRDHDDDFDRDDRDDRKDKKKKSNKKAKKDDPCFTCGEVVRVVKPCKVTVVRRVVRKRVVRVQPQPSHPQPGVRRVVVREPAHPVPGVRTVHPGSTGTQLVSVNGPHDWFQCKQSARYIVLNGSIAFKTTSQNQQRTIMPCFNEALVCRTGESFKTGVKQCCQAPLKGDGETPESAHRWACKIKELGPNQAWTH